MKIQNKYSLIRRCKIRYLIKLLFLNKIKNNLLKITLILVEMSNKRMKKCNQNK